MRGEISESFGGSQVQHLSLGPETAQQHLYLCTSLSTSHNRIFPHPFTLLDVSGDEGRAITHHTARHTDGHSVEQTANATHKEGRVCPISAPGGALNPSESNCAIFFLAQGSESPLQPFMWHR